MFILYFALWVVLNGRWTTEIGAFGLVFAAVAYVFSCKFMGYKLSLDFALLRRVPSAVAYGFMLLSEIVKSNVTVMRMILDRNFEPKPHLVKFSSGLKKERHRVVLANSITMTPGTITVDVQDDLFLIHCLDESFDVGQEGFEMEDRILRIEGQPSPAPVPELSAGEHQPVAAATLPETEEKEAALDE